MDWRALAAVGVGGCVGSVLRYLVSTGMAAAFGSRFPWGTLVVNAVGGLLIGFLLEWEAVRGLAPQLRLLLVTGLLGGLTTFSAFSHDTVTLLADGRWGLGLWNAALNLSLGFGGVLLGKWSVSLL